MTFGELIKRTNRALKGFDMQKYIFIAVTLVVLICSVLGSFYFQLAQNEGMQLILTLVAIITSVVLTFILLSKQTKEHYMRCIVTAYGGRVDTADLTTAKALQDKAVEMTKGVIDGVQGFKKANADTAELLGGMLTDCAAFEKYADKGFKTKLANFFLRFVFSNFKDFAILDCLMFGGQSVRNYGVASSTRWYKVYQKWTKGIIASVISFILPFILWIIGYNVLVSVLDSMIDINGFIQNTIMIVSFCLMLQMRTLTNRQRRLNQMVITLLADDMPQADFNICMAFANISTVYYNRCVEAGYIQQTSTAAPMPQVDSGTQPLSIEGAEVSGDEIL